MTKGYVFNDNVSIGNLAIENAKVTSGLDGTITLAFGRGEIDLAEMDALLNGNPNVTIGDEVLGERKLQAYRVDASGMVEVSFLADVVEEIAEEGEEDGEVD